MGNGLRLAVGFSIVCEVVDYLTPLAGLRARAADVGQILETLCAMGQARRGPPSAKATAGQANADGTFLP